MTLTPRPEAALQDELARALDQFRSLLDRDTINALQPLGPAAIYTPWVVVWLLVYQRLHANASLRDAVTELLRCTDCLPTQRRVREGTLSANTAAYSQARQRLAPEVTVQVADHVYQTLVATTPPSWGGRRVFLLDGTTITLTPTPELTKAFPPATNQHGSSAWPVCQLLVAHELASGCALRPEVGAMYGPGAVSELQLAQRLLLRLPEQSIVLADGNFGIFAFCQAAVETGHAVVVRLTPFRFRAMVRRAQLVIPGAWTLRWQPSRWDRQAHPELPLDACLEVHLHEVRVSDSLTLYLATTLRESAGQLAELYRFRQDVETDIRDVKVTLKTEQIRSKSESMLAKELALSMVAYNLVVQVRRLAAQRAGVRPRRLSFTGVWSLVRIILLQANDWTPNQWQTKFDLVLRAAAQRKLPHRPGRRYPRQVIPRRRKYPDPPRHPPPE